MTFYNTNLYNKGHYLDLVAKVGKARGNYNLNGIFPEYADSNSWFYSLSAEYGRKIINANNGWYIEPQAQLTWGHMAGDNYTSTQNNHANLDAINSLIFRAGTTLGRHLDKRGKSNYYAKLFWSHEFSGDSVYNFRDKNDTFFSDNHDYNGSWWTVGLGANINLDKKTHVYLDLEKNFSAALQTKWQLNLPRLKSQDSCFADDCA